MPQAQALPGRALTGSAAASSTTCQRVHSRPPGGVGRRDRRHGRRGQGAPRRRRTASPSPRRWWPGWTSSASTRCCCRPATSAATARSTRSTTSTSRPAGTRWRPLATTWPGRFAALALIDPERRHGRRAGDPGGASPSRGSSAVYLHTHSWDRRLDHADFYPFYALATELDVPVVDAGRHVGRPDAQRVRAADRRSTGPRSTSPSTRFVLSHLGWPWVDEAIAMALKFPNVYLGTGAYPPRHWPPAVQRFLRGPGRAQGAVRHELPDRRPPPRLGPARASSISTPDVADGVAARHRERVFTAAPPKEDASHDRQGLQHAAPAAGRRSTPATSTAGAVTFGVEYRDVDPASLAATYEGNAAQLAELEERSPDGGFSDEGVSIHVCGTDDGHEYVRFDVFDDEPHYHYIHRRPPTATSSTTSSPSTWSRSATCSRGRSSGSAPGSRRCSPRPAARSSPSSSTPRRWDVPSTTSRRWPAAPGTPIAPRPARSPAGAATRQRAVAANPTIRA